MAFPFFFFFNVLFYSLIFAFHFQLKLIGFLMGTILIGVAGVAIYRYKY